jgi:enoyl-CoA hydratase/carnithine racemase
MGIANTVLPAADVVNHAMQVAARFCTLPPAAVRETKKLMKAGLARALRDTINVELDVFGTQLRGPEANEAIEAFLQKRKADFSRFR